MPDPTIGLVTMDLQMLPTLVLTFLLLSPSPVSSSSLDSFVRCFSTFVSNTTAASILHTPNTPSYNTVFLSNAQNKRTIYSIISHKPLLIITPATSSHVQVSVLCSRRNGLRIRTRSGGHDYEGLSYTSIATEPFILLDLSILRDITVDVGSNTAWTGAGAILGELYYHIAKATPSYGFPGGTCSTVGLGGYLSGGGLGTMMRKYGTAADNVIDAVLVDAEGNILDRDTMGEELFWAIRGGGAASFGIVLFYKVELVPVPSSVAVFSVWRTLEENVTKILSKWEQIGSKLIDDLFIRAVAEVLEDWGGATIGVRFECLFLGGKGELLAYLGQVFPELGIAAWDVLELSWIDSVRYFAGLMDSPPEALLDREPQFDRSFKAKSDFVQEPIGEKGLERIWEFMLRSNGEPLVLILEPMGGMLDRVPESATPFPHRKGNVYNIQYFMEWTETDAVVTERHLDWMRELYAFMAPYVSKNPRGAYLNYKDIDLGVNVEGRSCLGDVGWGRKYFKGNYDRLVKVKCLVDRDDFFWSEQSVPPKCDGYADA